MGKVRVEARVGVGSSVGINSVFRIWVDFLVKFWGSVLDLVPSRLSEDIPRVSCLKYMTKLTSWPLGYR